MMRKPQQASGKPDWALIALYLVMITLGWLNIFAVEHNSEYKGLFDLSKSFGKQLMFISIAIVLGILILMIDAKFYSTFGYAIYGAILLTLLLVLVFGREVAGSKSWIRFGSFALQPAEFAKFATGLALAKYLGDVTTSFNKNMRTRLISFAIVGLPALLILAQNDTGSAMVFSVFALVLYREGFPGYWLLLAVYIGIIFVLALIMNVNLLIGILVGIAVILAILMYKNKQAVLICIVGAIISSGVVGSVSYVFENVLQPHQRDRFMVLFDNSIDPRGIGWNLNQSKTAIGSGGFSGKGFLNGTQTKFDYVPEQNTDFIFCTVGEEHGWIGSLVLITLFVTLLLRIVFIAERQRTKFSRIYAYSVASIIFFHFAINISMTIGLFPVVGIPLPFFSYGGSSLIAFTVMLFILIKLDSHRIYEIDHS